MAKEHVGVLIPYDIASLLDQKGNNRAPELMANFVRIAEELAGNLTTLNFADKGTDGSVVLKEKSVGTAQIADDVIIPKVTRGRYTGDGTASRTITLPWTPIWVFVLSLTDSIEFSSLDDGTEVARWYRSQTGDLSSAAAEWQGIVANGFMTGSNAESLSNKSAQVYSYLAIRNS
jgi:hypothetical protein